MTASLEDYPVVIVRNGEVSVVGMALLREGRYPIGWTALAGDFARGVRQLPPGPIGTFATGAAHDDRR